MGEGSDARPASRASTERHVVIDLLLSAGVILPLLVVLPIAIQHWGLRRFPEAPLEIALLAVFCNLLPIGLMLWLVKGRLTRQQRALQEMSLALDGVAIAWTRPDGEITYWSHGCEKLFGWSAAEAVGRKKHDLLHSRPEEAAAGVTERVVLDHCSDGRAISVLEQTQVLERPARETLCVVRMLDITDRVAAETALRLSEGRLAAAAEAHQLGISEWDVKTDRLEWSAGSEQRLGLPTGTLATFQDWYAFVYPEDAQGVLDTIHRAVANRDERATFRYRFRQADGSVRTIEGSARCFYDQHGALETVIAANLDVTERNERDTASQLRSIIETIPDATVVIDSTGTVRSFSPAAEDMFGVDAAAAIGRCVTFLMPEAIAAWEDASKGRVLESGALHMSGTTRELTGRRADGSPFPVEVNIGEAWLNGERIFMGVIRDMSDRIAAEQRMSDLNAELAHLSRQSAMSELAADLAHELNQPLSATANFLATARILIERGADGRQVADLLRLGEEQTLRSGEIIRRLRDFLAKREGEMRVESLQVIVREAVELVLFGTAEFAIRLTYALDPAADKVFADRIQIQQVLVNLLRNAVDALRPQPVGTREIVIASRAVGDSMIEVSVSDNGPGLPTEIDKRLYSRFATTKDGPAMGIGLSISRRIVEAHGGTLIAENQADRGAIFRFTLPALEEIEE